MKTIYLKSLQTVGAFTSASTIHFKPEQKLPIQPYPSLFEISGVCEMLLTFLPMQKLFVFGPFEFVIARYIVVMNDDGAMRIESMCVNDMKKTNYFLVFFIRLGH